MTHKELVEAFTEVLAKFFHLKKDPLPVKLIQFHNSGAFVCGKSWAGKVEVHMHSGMSVAYDYEIASLVMEYNGKREVIPSTSVLSYTPGEVKPRGPVKGLELPSLKSAQVSTPQSHVHAGPGAGKTGVFK